MTKEDIFCIMGNKYGNAYYRAAIRLHYTEKDLHVIKDILDHVNALGYSISDLFRLTEIQDKRFVPILLSRFSEFQSINLRGAVFQYIHFKAYSEFVPQIIDIYLAPQNADIRFDIGQALYFLYDKKYNALYLKIISQVGYEENLDMVIEALCKRKIPEALPHLIRIYKANPTVWARTFLHYIGRYRNPIYISDVVLYLDSPDPELRNLAKKALSQLQS